LYVLGQVCIVVHSRDGLLYSDVVQSKDDLFCVRSLYIIFYPL